MVEDTGLDNVHYDHLHTLFDRHDEHPTNQEDLWMPYRNEC